MLLSRMGCPKAVILQWAVRWELYAGHRKQPSLGLTFTGDVHVEFVPEVGALGGVEQISFAKCWALLGVKCKSETCPIPHLAPPKTLICQELLL